MLKNSVTYPAVVEEIIASFSQKSSLTKRRRIFVWSSEKIKLKGAKNTVKDTVSYPSLVAVSIDFWGSLLLSLGFSKGEGFFITVGLKILH